MRGSDVECNPVFYSYAIVTKDDAILYVEPSKVTDEVKQHLGDQVTLKPYSAAFDDLRQLKETLTRSGKKLLTNPKTSLAVEVAVGEVRVCLRALVGVSMPKLFHSPMYWRNAR